MKKRLICIFVCVLLIATTINALGATSKQFSTIKSNNMRDYRLLIIAPDEFIDELEPLKNHKDASSMPTILLSLTTVYDDFNNPDWDVAEKVKRCIAHNQQVYGIEYVMLVGDIDKFPGRFSWWGLPNQEGSAVSDHYYADLFYEGGTFCDWDYNNNDLYGEIEFFPDGVINNDLIDYYLDDFDVAVGRIPASEEEEVATYVNKVIYYETMCTPLDSWFEDAALYTGDDPGGESTNDKMDQAGGSLELMGHNLIKRYYNWDTHQPPPDMPDAAIDDINNGVGFMNYMGHGGSTSGWGTNNPPQTYLSTSILDQLTNTGMCPIMFGCACDTGRFAPVIPVTPFIDTDGVEHRGTALGETFDIGSYPHPNYPQPHPLQHDGDDGGIWYNGDFHPFDLPCFAETLLFGHPDGEPGSGAIAYLGARTGGQVTGTDLDLYFFWEYFDVFTPYPKILGDIWKYMMNDYYYLHDIGNAHTWFLPPDQWPVGHKFMEPQKYILFGDPSLRVGGIGLPYIQVDLTGGLDGVSATIKNEGRADASNVNWKIKVTGGLFGLVNIEKAGTIPHINIGGSNSVSTGSFLGFGPIQITVSIDNVVMEEKNGLQIIIYTLVL